MGKSVVVVPERPPAPEPGTSVFMVAGTKAAGSVPPEVGSMAGVRPPAPSWFTCLVVLEKEGMEEEIACDKVAGKVLKTRRKGACLTWWKTMLMVPSSPTVGSPDVAPVPAPAATPFSVVPLAVLVPAASLVPAPAPPPPSLSNSPRLTVELEAAVAPVAPMKVEMALAASTGPPPSVRPRAEALLVPSSFSRMMEVSASAPQRGVAQSRGVPSMTGSGKG